MWIARTGYPQPLTVTATKAGRNLPDLTYTANASSPGAMYVSGLALTEPGCWHLKMSWAGQQAVVDLIAVGAASG
jgi:hypothetical protein